MISSKKSNPLLNTIAESVIVQVPFTMLIYSFYCAVFGLALMPSFSFAYLIYKEILPVLIKNLPLFLFGCGLFVMAFCYIYFMAGALILGTICRIMSLGIKPKRHPQISFTMLRWLLVSGIYSLAVKTILPFITMSWFINKFFQLFGCKMGKNVRINSPYLNDPYLLELEDNVVIGAQAEISCHTFEGGRLTLGRIKIGENTVIGAKAYIMPGATIGKNCRIGLNTVVRKNKTLPDKTDLLDFPSLQMRDLVSVKKQLHL
jgi:acetyltransferase-like isoleucine patch superfamily enzyme